MTSPNFHVFTSDPSSRVRLGVERNQSATPELFPHRALAVTRSFRKTEREPIVLRRAKMLRRVLKDHPVIIQDGELIVGMKTLRPRGSPLFPEVNAAWAEKDLDTLAARNDTPFFVSDETKKLLREEVFPYWHGKQIYDRLLESVPQAIWDADERGIIYNYFCSVSSLYYPHAQYCPQSRIQCRQATHLETGVRDSSSG